MTSATKPHFGRKAALWLLVATGVLIFAGANAHLIYVAATSQPDCVAHARPGDTAGQQYSAAKSSCTSPPAASPSASQRGSS
jgi:hypothetical protein